MDISTFFKTERISHASYDNVRKICSLNSGLKLSSNKIIYLMLKENITKEFKVSRLASRVSEKTEYLHGEASLEQVIVQLARKFAGANNVPLLRAEGTFGDVVDNTAAASRYIFTALQPYTPYLFRKEDTDILELQEFEGTTIEPKFMYPIVPIWALNGSKGISSGFAQLILGRNPKEIVKYIKAKLNGESTKSIDLTPYFDGFTGTVKQDTSDDKGSNAWIITGKCEDVNLTTIRVTELPIGYNLVSYKAKLDKLEDEGKIASYKDLTDNGKFNFEIKFKKQAKPCLSKAISLLKLTTKISENYTVIDGGYRVQEFDKFADMLDAFIDIRLEKYEERRKSYLQSLKNDCTYQSNKLYFVKSVIEGTIIVNKKTKAEIIEQLDASKLQKHDGSYNYLLSMPIYSMSKEKLVELLDMIKKIKAEIERLEKATPNMLWLSDLDDLTNKFGDIF